MEKFNDADVLNWHNYYKIVKSADLDGEDIKFYNTQSKTERDIFSSPKVCMAISGQRRMHKGRKFRKTTFSEIKKYGRLTT